MTFILLACWPASVFATEEQRPRITVSGNGQIESPPDVATIEFRVIGEGETSDAAVTALVARQRVIVEKTASLATATPTASRVSIDEVRGAGCKRTDDDSPRLSTGACMVIGYIAAVDMTVRSTAVKDAGTLVGLLGRLKASDPHIEGFSLADPQAAERRAIAGALLDARRRAEAIAMGTGVRLGRLLIATTVNERSGGEDIVVTARRAAPAPAIVAPPIAIDLTPRPIETQAQVTVTYEIAS